MDNLGQVETKKINLLNLSLEEYNSLFVELGQKSFRTTQLLKWLYQKKVVDFDVMSNLGQKLIQELKGKVCVEFPELSSIKHSSDGSKKFLLKLTDGNFIETVLMKHERHYSLCISSQVGCAMGCKFCLTATMGLTRNLTSGEILAQVFIAEKYCEEELGVNIRNIVFMGMGEPLQNYNNLLKALRILTAQGGFNFSAKRITISTVGLLPRIAQLLREPNLKVNLAISLNGSNQAARLELMPVAKQYSLNQLTELLQAEFKKGVRERVMFEYILIAGVSDSPQSARELVGLLGNSYCKVNLIAYNENPFLPYKRPSGEHIYQFQKYLLDHGVLATQRHSKGQDIQAACGQLALEKKSNLPVSY